MTLCIAAKTYQCYDADYSNGSVIVCSDRRIESPTAASDIGYKGRILNDQWNIMMAGVFPLAVELTDIFEQELKKPAPLGVCVIERLRAPIDIFKARVGERFTRSRYAGRISYDGAFVVGRSVVS